MRIQIIFITQCLPDYFRTLDKADESDGKTSPGRIELKNLGSTITRRHADLVNKTDQKTESVTLPSKNVKKSKREYQSPIVSEGFL